MSGPEFVYVVQTAIGRAIIFGQEVQWCWDLNDVHATLADAETSRGEWFFEDQTTRIVKMKLFEVEVIQTFELPELKPAGVLF